MMTDPTLPNPNHSRLRTETVVVTQQAKNRAAIYLIQQWLDDESGYDQKAWPILKQTIEENRLSTRKRFKKVGCDVRPDRA